MVRHKLDSVSDFARGGYFVRARCLGCERTSDLNPALLMQQLHQAKRSQKIEDLEYALRCRQCGHRGAHVTPALIDF